MVGEEAALEIRVLHRHGKGIREIARATGSSRNTVRRYLRDESAARYKLRPPRATKLDPFRDYVVDRLKSAARSGSRQACCWGSCASGAIPADIRCSRAWWPRPNSGRF